MAKVLRLGAISPTHLNLNGDLGNLIVLRKRLALRGVQSEIVSLNGYEILQEFDFILVGHGSKSAWQQLLASVPGLFARISEFARQGGAVMAIASAADLLQPMLTGVEVEYGNWVSEFVESEGVVGYLNTTSKAPLVEWYQNSLLTQFHGPVLAKNPGLADEIISRNNWVGEVKASEELNKLDELAKQSRRIAFEH